MGFSQKKKEKSNLGCFFLYVWLVGDLSLVGCCWLVMEKICEYFEVHDLNFFLDWALKCPVRASFG